MHPAPHCCGDPQPLGRYPGYSHKGLFTPAPCGVGRLARLATASISADPLSLSMSTDTPKPSTAKIWLLAVRPQTLTAGVVPVVVGTALAARDGVMHLPAAIAALLGALFIQVGTNLFNDYEDFRRGADTAERIGPARVTQRGWLTPRQVGRASILAFAAAIAAGVYLVARAGWPLVALGLTSVVCGLAYTGGPLPLAYHGLGDLFVMLFFGIAAVCGTYYVQAFQIPESAFLVSLSVGALATCILVVNNLRDRETDAKANKRTLVVRFGPTAARAEYGLLLALAYAVPVYLALQTGGYGWLLPVASLPLALREFRAVCTTDGPALNRHLGGAARVGLLFGLLLSVGVNL
jgi:1,4-dihydroxy-2-naphthoate octaprenyltransferase